jgi:hypothetical protein
LAQLVFAEAKGEPKSTTLMGPTKVQAALAGLSFIQVNHPLVITQIDVLVFVMNTLSLMCYVCYVWYGIGVNMVVYVLLNDTLVFLIIWFILHSL